MSDADAKKKPARPAGLLDEDRPQPHNLETERAVLAAILREPASCGESVVELLGPSPDVFYSHVHREIYKCALELKKNSVEVDPLTLADALRRKGVLDEIGGEVYIADLYNAIATTANFENWCEIVREYHILRGMINVCSDSLRKCYEVDTDIKTLVDEIETNIYKVREDNTKQDIISLKDSIKDVFAEIQKVINKEKEVGIPTPYTELNRLIVGLKPGEMIVIAARPSIGKTTFALNLLHYVAMKGNRQRGVLFFSLEMTAEQIARKLLCMEAQVSESSFYDGSFRPSDLQKLTGAVSELRKANIFIDPTAGLTIAELRAKARRMKTQHHIELICIDYLQLMRAGGDAMESRQQEVASISSGIKSLAKDLNVPVVVLAQLNREVEKSTSRDARPKLSNLRESGAIEQDADIVSFLHRDRDQTKNMTREAMEKGVETELIVEKNRNGQTGVVFLTFHPHIGQFRERSRYSDDDNPEKAG